MSDDKLFEVEPVEVNDDDGELYDAGPGSTKTSPTENHQIRMMLWQEKTRVLGEEHPLGCDCQECGQFRGKHDLAGDYIRVAEGEGLRVPGADWRQPLREGETIEDRRVDAARTRIRQFEKGTNQADWFLNGIEATICDRNGWPRPTHPQQERLDVDPVVAPRMRTVKGGIV